jgi:hypothetical protein
MLKFKQFILKEEQDVHHDVTFIRGNPIHAGHESVVNQVMNSAKNHGGGHSIILTRTQDKKKNPLQPEQKLKYAKQAFPNSNVQLATNEAPTLMHVASQLHDQNVNNLHLHVGSDRVDEFKKLLNNYNGVAGRHGYYNFKNINVYPVGGARNADDTGITSYSATKMRDAAQLGDRAAFHAMAPSGMTAPQKDAMMADTYAGMNPPPKQKVTKTK